MGEFRMYNTFEIYKNLFEKSNDSIGILQRNNHHRTDDKFRKYLDISNMD